MTVKLALFDCDGTLVDSQANICRAMENAFTQHALPTPDRAAVRRIVGLSLPEAMGALLPDASTELHRDLAESYKRTFRAMRDDGTLDAEPLFDGVAATLRSLRDDGWVLGVATGKSDRGLAHILDHHGMTDLFVTLQTADRHPSKPDPAMVFAGMAEAGASPSTTAMIGDTSFDMAMGRASGARTVGVAWGYHTVGELMAAGADVVAEHAMQLPGLVARP
ncbi:phosphoglycolate phosphatase [Sphingomonas gellani]|uniref:Phosphoglycolate phosphatase n=1 Tax=Sphingomonas gellani TaxID=1166340 RepID=A0A1H8G1P7_9SPHN|nr:HAD-IA family hydrolase [Sphingomonas gellani]SEN37695.1 phosphoglycolate phosphatase [Sphingomonas gellani]